MFGPTPRASGQYALLAISALIFPACANGTTPIPNGSGSSLSSSGDAGAGGVSSSSSGMSSSSGGMGGMGGIGGAGGMGGSGGAIPDCGNGVVDSGELCDGNCPMSCPDDGNKCTIESLVGSAMTCDAMCTTQTIEMCQSGDGCCPVGCTAANDFDCANCTVIVPDQYPTITAAIQASPVPGMVCIRAGTYSEGITMRPRVSLQGEGIATRIEGRLSVMSMLSMDSSTTYVRDLLVHAGNVIVTACSPDMSGFNCGLIGNGQTISLAFDGVTLEGNPADGTMQCMDLEITGGSLFVSFRDSICRGERGIRFRGDFVTGKVSQFALEVLRSRFEPDPTTGWTYDGIEFLSYAGSSCGAETPAAGSLLQAKIVNNEFLSTHYEGIYLTPCLTMNAADAANSRMFVVNNTFVPDPMVTGDTANAVWYNSLSGYGPDFTYANNLYLGPQGNPVRAVQPDFMAGNLNTTASPFVNAAGLDVHLVAGSAPIDAASVMYAPFDDKDGKTRPVDGNGDMMSLPDIGAHEFVP